MDSKEQTSENGGGTGQMVAGMAVSSAKTGKNAKKMAQNAKKVLF